MFVITKKFRIKLFQISFYKVIDIIKHYFIILYYVYVYRFLHYAICINNINSIFKKKCIQLTYSVQTVFGYVR